MTTSFENSSSIEGLCDKAQDVWCLDNKQLFTTDWVGEEGDSYTVSPQLELEQAIRLSELQKDSELIEHPFFQNVDWDMMEKKQVVLPFKPNMSEEFGLDNFDSQFTDEPVRLTPDDNNNVRKTGGYEFAGFEYINRLSMYEEEWV
ncbi:Protein kinase C iota type [Heterocephalus glaber]|uniref:Protein kinase C iota type n=1 Tax=Heterocephalus glaber TaxID=10181 RepID=G5BFA1_HETGA|nr:Protein kinase C iota type [Heterocephalus glaber]